MLDLLSRRRSGHSRRISSWDVTGRNRDSWVVEPGETRSLADIPGAGVIRHIWFTIGSEDRLYLRKAVLRMYWDGMERPSVECPVGDFFGVGHGRVGSFSCAVLNMSANPGNDQNAGMNCYFPMPFADGARITLENQGETCIRSLYCCFDYDALPSVGDDELRFHAWWNRENPCIPAAGPDTQDARANLSDAENYLLVEASGAGHFVGAHLSIHNLCGGWWGEGDDMFMVDGQKWPPDLHGTGTEDWYGQAWGSQPQNAFLYNGVSYHQGNHNDYNERITVYRYHVCDPVIFHESLRVSIEHGHANDRADDYSSVAYWYQTLPHAPFPPLPPVAARLPRANVRIQPVDLPLRPDRPVSGSGFDPSYS